MAFELLLCTGGDDQIGHLWRQEATQLAHAFYLAYLVGNTLFQMLV
jgi:hypothetical protein